LLFGDAFWSVASNSLALFWHRHGFVEDDGLGAYFLSIQVLVGAVVSAKSRTHERYSGEESAEASPPSLTLLLRNAGCGTGAHEQQNEIRGIFAEPQTSAAAFESHRWSTPVTMKHFATPVGHHTAAVAATETNGKL
jgi:hypothetical protein